MENRIYATVDSNSFSQAVASGELDLAILFDNILETNTSTLRKSLDESMFVIKTDSLERAAYLRQRATELGVGYNEYSYSEILVIMASNAWSDSSIM